jgi:cyclopropane-fatty-acyl-phospholipid synthase
MNYDLIWQALRNADFGSLSITLPNQEKLEFKGKNPGPLADITINDFNMIDRVISGGDVAFGETYIEGLWQSHNLAQLLTFLTLNAHALEDFFHAKKWQSFVLFFKSLFTKNTKTGSRKNISFHYDLGNDFYQIWLDSSMTYSSAIFKEKNATLFDAQIAKYRNILEKLSGNSILEIGCGWGGFAKEAAQNGFDLKCLTLSKKQREFAIKKLSDLGLASKVEVALQDYRDEKKTYDNVVSIEMFEAVGQEYWETYFSKVNQVLKENGKAVLQIITIDEEVFRDYKNRVDFIQKHIFPGGVLPSKSIIRALSEKFGFEIKSEFSFGFDYAKTLEIWLKNFDEKKSEIQNLNFPEEFIRKWRFYLAYCIAGFLSKRTDVVQFELVKKSK